MRKPINERIAERASQESDFANIQRLCMTHGWVYWVAYWMERYCAWQRKKLIRQRDEERQP